jgi:hypothetical protein
MPRTKISRDRLRWVLAQFLPLAKEYRYLGLHFAPEGCVKIGEPRPPSPCSHETHKGREVVHHGTSVYGLEREWVEMPSKEHDDRVESLIRDSWNCPYSDAFLVGAQRLGVRACEHCDRGEVLLWEPVPLADITGEWCDVEAERLLNGEWRPLRR